MQNDGEFSEPFEVTNGVKQGCVLAPTLFSMMFSAMLMDAFQDSDTGFPIRYRFDGNIFNLRRLQAKTKVQTDVLDELLYADDMDKSRQRSGKGAIRKRFPLQKPRWEKTKLTIRNLYHETYRKPNEQLFSE